MPGPVRVERSDVIRVLALRARAHRAGADEEAPGALSRMAPD